MKVCYSPRDIDNPYINLLYNEIEENEEDVTTDGFTFSCLGLKKIRHSVDILHIHWLPGLYFRNSFLPVALLFMGRFVLLLYIATHISGSIVWTGHNLWPHEMRHPRLERFIRSRILSTADIVFVHCKEAGESFKQEFEADFEYRVVDHGNYPSESNKIDQKSARERLGVEQNDVMVLNFGTLRRYKGHKKLCELFAEYTTDSVLYIAGKTWDEEYTEEIHNISENCKRINLHNEFIPEDMVSVYFAAADFVVLPYTKILMSGNVMLSLSMGTPVVAPKKGCIPRYVSKSCGFLYKTESELIDVLSKVDNKNMPDYDPHKIRDQARKYTWRKSSIQHYRGYKQVYN